MQNPLPAKHAFGNGFTYSSSRSGVKATTAVRRFVLIEFIACSLDGFFEMSVTCSVAFHKMVCHMLFAWRFASLFTHAPFHDEIRLVYSRSIVDVNVIRAYRQQ